MKAFEMGTHYDGTEDEVRALDAYIKLLRAAGSVGAAAQRQLAGTDLSASQFAVLEALFHLGPLSQREIGKKLLKSGGNITLVIDNLEKRGLVRRERDTEDRRVIRVQLTDEGRGIIEGIFPGHVRSILERMSTLTPAEQDELGRLCKKLGRKAEGSTVRPAGKEGRS